MKARRFLNSSLSATFLSSAALATSFMSIRNDSTLSSLVAGSICARLGPSSSSASVTSLLRISAPFTLASTGLASSAARAGATSRDNARLPARAVARPKRRPVFVTGNDVVMENPCLGRGGSRGVASGRRGHSPNRDALATRKVCQFREIGDRFGADVPVSGAVDNVPPQPYLSPIAARAIALILLRFWPLNPGLLVSHSSDGRPPGADVRAWRGCCGASRREQQTQSMSYGCNADP